MHHKCPSKGRSQYFSLNLSITDLSSTQTHFYSTTKAFVQIDGVSPHANHVSPLPIHHMDVLTFKTYKNIHFQNVLLFGTYRISKKTPTHWCFGYRAFSRPL